MPKSVHVPAYRLHKPSGQARVILRGRQVYLGPYGSPESRERYARLIAEQAANPTAVAASTSSVKADGKLLIVQLCAAYLEHAQRYYSRGGAYGVDASGHCLSESPAIALRSHACQ